MNETERAYQIANCLKFANFKSRRLVVIGTSFDRLFEILAEMGFNAEDFYAEANAR